jgi:hypothetical protein
VPPDRGLPRLRDIAVSGLTASGAKQAFAVASYQDSPLRNVRFRDLEIEAAAGGSIQNAEDWSFVASRIRITDGRPVKVLESRGVRGLRP